MKILLRSLLLTIALLPLLCTAQRQQPVKVRIMTFNIRLVNPNDGVNNWEMRFLKVGEFLNSEKADIICLQEVTQVQLNDISNAMPNYQSVGVARDDGKQAGEYNPIFYNTERFNLLSKGTFWLSPTPDHPSRGWDAACNRIATWAILQDKDTFKSIMVTNTHLDHIGIRARLNSATYIKEHIGRMVNDLPIVIAGDFNVDENDPVYNKITSSIFRLSDVWKLTNRTKGPAYTYHGFGKVPANKAKKIDYIFTSPRIKVRKATIIDTSLGHGLYLSDHNAHLADIIF